MITSKAVRQAASRTYSNPDKTDDMLRTTLCEAADTIDALAQEVADVRRMLAHERDTVRRYEEEWIDEHI